jgi:TRAP-type C4-dicarboxylate transport system permease small subunit
MPPSPSRFIRGLLLLIRALLGFLILFGVVLNFANVVGRYVFLRPIIWAEEILIFVMVWCVLLGASLVSWEGRHLRMEVVYSFFPEWFKRWVNLFITISFLGIGVFVVIQSAEFVALVTRTDQKSVVAEIPMIIPYSAIPISFGLMVLLVAWRFRAFVRGEVGSEIASIDDHLDREFSDEGAKNDKS